MKLLQFLKDTILFGGLSDRDLKEISKISIRKSYVSGQLIFSEGEEAKGFFFVIEGRVKIFKLSSDGREQILHIIREGQSFGEVPVFAGRNYPASAEAIDDTTLLFFLREDFLKLIRHNPDIALNMLSVLSLRLRRLTYIVENLSLKEVSVRLASYLLYQIEREGGKDRIRLDVKKSHLASMLGTIPETLSRNFSKMVKAGLIEMEGNRYIKILDRSSLERIAEGEIKL